MHIEIVCSAQKRLSSMSLVSRDAILTVLKKHYSDARITILNDVSDLEALVERSPDLVFLGMQFISLNPELGTQDPNLVWISDYLDENDIAYTGSGQSAHILELNKPLAKQRLQEVGLKTARFYVAVQNQFQNREDMKLSLPVFIKPTDRGGGLGIDEGSLANSFEDIQAKTQSITDTLQSDSLIEEYLPGREFSVAILKNTDSEEFSVMPIELAAPLGQEGSCLLSGDVKSSNTEVILEVTDPNLNSELTTLARGAFLALGARDYGRIDIRLDKHGTPHFLEANLLPSLISGYGSFPKACVLNIGLDYESMILRIVQLGLARTADNNENVFEYTNSLTFPSLETALKSA